MQSAQKEQNVKLAHYWACRYSWAAQIRNDIDLEDLQQAALLGIIQARNAYQDEKGGFVTLAGYYARNEIRDLLGIRNGKLPPVLESLDEPLNDETEDTRLDLIADDSIPDADAGLLEAEKRQAVRDAVNRLKKDQRAVIDCRFFQGMTHKQTAEAAKIPPSRLGSVLRSAQTNLRRDRLLRALLDDCTQYMLHVGIARFNTTMTSAVEELVIRRERLENLALERLEEDKNHCKDNASMV